MSQYHTTNNGQQPSYQNRYRRGGHTLLDGMYTAGPYVIAIVSFLIALVALMALLAVDVITGQYTASHMSNEQFGWFSSFATTGLVLALIGTAMYGYREGWSWKALLPLVIVSMVPVCIDVYFDGLSVDIIRFGQFIIPSQHFGAGSAEVIPHQLYRVMVGALSAVGEPLAAGSVIIFPIMKELFKGIFQ